MPSGAALSLSWCPPKSSPVVTPPAGSVKTCGWCFFVALRAAPGPAGRRSAFYGLVAFPVRVLVLASLAGAAGFGQQPVQCVGGNQDSIA